MRPLTCSRELCLVGGLRSGARLLPGVGGLQLVLVTLSDTLLVSRCWAWCLSCIDVGKLLKTPQPTVVTVNTNMITSQFTK